MAHIKTFCRIKPVQSDFTDYQAAHDVLHIQIPENYREIASGQNVRQRGTINHDFKFTYIFKPEVQQGEVFDKIAKNIVESFLGGYNGTIFAYGQTGSGKTYTMEGNARRYQDRGLAPRALSLIYKSLASRQENEEIDIHVSYMEIYQEVGYDLLNPAARLGAIVTTFPKVSVVEGPGGTCVIRNLSQHLAASEEVAQGLLIEGQANRKVAETPMNQRSSRSHAVFTIQLSARKPNEDIITRSKLHLVDLAGSERASKSGIEGQQLAEAKYINLSLHYLEGVIIALQQEATNTRPSLPTPNFTLYNSARPGGGRCMSAPCQRTIRWVNSTRPNSAGLSTSGINPLGQSAPPSGRHIPYRNSLLTMVLRDSLGGNCNTAMVATITFEEQNLGESLSTCRFAQRVACITNIVCKNEEIDDKSLIRKLRKRVAELETELSLLREGLALPATGATSGKLTDEDRAECGRIMQAYLHSRLNDPITAGITTPARYRECLRLLKGVILDRYGNGSDGVPKVILDGRKKAITNDSNQGPAQFPPISPPSSSSPSTPPVSMTTSTSLQRTTYSDWSDLKWTERKTRKLQEAESQAMNEENRSGQDRDPINEPNLGQVRQNGSVLSMRNKNSQGQGSRPVSTESRSSTGHRSTGSQKQIRNRSKSAVVRSTSQTDAPQPAPRPGSNYKSPFERQRERDIKRLDKKVSSSEASLRDDQEKLEIQQADIRVAQLSLIQKQLSNKLVATREQLKQQKLYILQLQTTDTDPDFIQQEKIAARQLRKREIQLERRLQLVDEESEKLVELHEAEPPIPKPRPSRHPRQHTEPQNTESIIPPNSQTTTKSQSDLARIRPHTAQPTLNRHIDTSRIHPSLGAGDNMAGMGPVASQGGKEEGRNRDVKLNSRQLLTLLQEREKEQDQMRSGLETQKIYTLSQQIELKEAATRQKLQEFREKLRLAKLNTSSAQSNTSFDQRENSHVEDAETVNKPMVTSSVSSGKPPIPSPRSAFTKLEKSTQDSRSQNEGTLVENGPRVRPLETQVFAWTSPNTQIKPRSPVSSISSISKETNAQTNKTSDTSIYSHVQEPGISNPANDSMINEKSTQKTALLNLLRSSRPSTSVHTRSAANLINEFGQQSLYKKDMSEKWGGKSISQNGLPDDMLDTQKGNITHKPSVPISSVPVKDTGYEQTPRIEGFAPPRITPTLSKGGSDTGHSNSDISAYEDDTGPGSKEMSGKDSGLQSGSSSSLTKHDSPKKFTESEPSRTKTSPDHSGHILLTEPGDCRNLSLSAETSNTNTEEFDFRNKSFGDQSFDEALQRMLGSNDIPKVKYLHEDYDQFARRRKGKSGSSSKRKASSAKRSSTATYGVDLVLDHHGPSRKTSTNTWGPESKNTSVSDQITKYLDTQTTEASSNSRSTGQTPGESTRHYTDQAPSQNEGSPRVKSRSMANGTDSDGDAGEEKAREEAYMASVRAERLRVARIRKARGAAEIIQRAWRKHKRK